VPALTAQTGATRTQICGILLLCAGRRNGEQKHHSSGDAGSVNRSHVKDSLGFARDLQNTAGFLNSCQVAHSLQW